MSYQKWITVNLEHGYFGDGGCPPLQFVPTGDCRKQMRRRGQFFYPLSNGFHIFRNSEKIKEGQGADAAGCFFDIAVYSPGKLLGNYSNLDIDYRRGGVYYIGGPLESSPAAGKEKGLTLRGRDLDGEVEAVPVLLKPKRFVIQPGEASPGDTFKLLDRNDRVIKENRVRAKKPDFSLYIDVSGTPAGIYRLERNNVVIARFYADDVLYIKRPAFIIGFDGACRHYTVRVAGRAVSWQYHVIARNNGRKLKNLGIRNNNETLLPGVSFERVRIDEQQKEAVFVSNKPVPLSDKGIQSIELTENGNSGTPLVPHLPNADIASLHVREGKWTAQIYVYI